MKENASVSAPVRVIHLIDELSLGGAEEIVLTLARRLDRKRYAMEVACLQAPGPLTSEVRDAGIPVTVFRQRNNYDPTVLHHLIPFMRRGRFTICHTHLFGADFWGRLASLAAGTPIRVSSVVAKNLDYTWKNHLANRVLARWTDQFISNSTSAITFVEQKTGVSEARFTRIDNPVEVDQFLNSAAPEEDQAALRAEWGLLPEDRLIGCVARLHEQKGHTYLLRAMRQVIDRVPEARLVLVGDGPLRESLEAEARDLGVAHRVVFCGYDRRLQLIYSLLEAKVLASLWEGSPLVLVQAMLAGVPVVATAVDGVRETVREREIALLVPPRDPEALAGAVVNLLTNPTLRAMHVKRARDFAAATFNADTVVRQYEAVYEACLARAGRRSIHGAS